MSDYDKEGEQCSFRAWLGNMHKPYILRMAQFQGVKIYEAPRCRLSYFALWHQTTKIDAMFKVLEPHVKAGGLVWAIKTDSV